MPVWSAKSRTWLWSAGTQPVIVEDRGSQLAGEREQLLHRLAERRLVSVSSPRSSGGACSIEACRRSETAVSA